MKVDLFGTSNMLAPAREILDEIDNNNIYTYPIADLRNTYIKLKDLYLDLRDNYRIIIAPCRPKPFSLVSLILGLEYNDIDIWRISPGSSAKPTDKIPSGQIGLLKLELSKE